MTINLKITRIPSIIRMIFVLTNLSLLTACALKPPPFSGVPGFRLNPYKIVINFASPTSCIVTSVDETGAACSGGGAGFCVDRGDFVWWESNPADIRYEIFFDPIFGARLKSTRHGYILRPVDNTAPVAEYKYSIVREGCAPDNTNTFDPRMRVNE